MQVNIYLALRWPGLVGTDTALKILTIQSLILSLSLCLTLAESRGTKRTPDRNRSKRHVITPLVIVVVNSGPQEPHLT